MAAYGAILPKSVLDIPRLGCLNVHTSLLPRWRGAAPIVVRGTAEGTILREAHGQNGFGYDPYFWYAPLKKSFAELSADEKNAVSHRHNALMLLKEALDGEDRRLL